VHENLPLLERVFRCDACGLVLDRGENASCTLAVLAIAVAGGGPWTGDVKRRGGDVRPAWKRPVPDEAGSRDRLVPIR
jgi:putative transposase